MHTRARCGAVRPSRTRPTNARGHSEVVGHVLRLFVAVAGKGHPLVRGTSGQTTGAPPPGPATPAPAGQAGRPGRGRRTQALTRPRAPAAYARPVTRPERRVRPPSSGQGSGSWSRRRQAPAIRRRNRTARIDSPSQHAAVGRRSSSSFPQLPPGAAPGAALTVRRGRMSMPPVRQSEASAEQLEG